MQLAHKLGMSQASAVKRNVAPEGGSNELQQRTLEALTAVAEATTPMATFRAITRARVMLGDSAEHYWPLIKTMAQRQGELEHMRRLAGTDDLTGVSNRRAFYDTLERELARRNRTGECVSVVIVDMDDLKWRNDTLGHASGDGALKALAVACEREVRTTDLVARLGGDEFGILLVDSDDGGAAAFLARLRSRIESCTIGGHGLSASIGVASATDGLPSAQSLVGEADAEMYRDKVRRKRERVSTTMKRPTASDERPMPGAGRAVRVNGT